MREYRSYAKINIFLDVVARYDNGFHGIKSIFMETDLADLIRCECNDSGRCLVVDPSNILPEDNLLTKAYAAFFAYAGGKPLGVTFTIDKRIPAGGGLGGGSSNAAVVLKILNSLSGMRFSDRILMKIGAQIGSDIPYFIKGGTAKVYGRGECVVPLYAVPLPLCCIALFPDIGVPTPDAYRWIDEDQVSHKSYYAHKKYRQMVRGVATGDSGLVLDGLYNKFEEPVFRRVPQLRVIKEDMLASGLDGALMSGSGSTLLGFALNIQNMNKCVDILIRKGYKVRAIGVNNQL